MALVHLKRTIEVATPGTKLYTRDEQLIVARPQESLTSVPIEELGVVVLDEARCSVTQSLLSKLAESCVCVVVCGRKHLPTGLLLPISGHSLQVQVQRIQLDATLPRKKRLWQKIIQAKIRAQGALLQHLSGSDWGLNKMANRVLSGDTTNIEAQAAQRYWRRLFDETFRRDRDQDGGNALLNYGYAIIRAAVARTIVATGMLPSIGLHHHNRSNAFCLADDLVEPYRPFVDARVREIVFQSGTQPNLISLDDRTIRAELLGVLSESVKIDGSSTPLGLSIAITTSSLRKCLESAESLLLLPILDMNEKSELSTPIRVETHRKTGARKKVVD